MRYKNITVQSEDFDISEALRPMRLADSGIGAIASFVGIVRDLNDNRDVSIMELEHYPGMTEHAIETIVDEAASRWRLTGAVVIHRVGRLAPTDQIVLVSTASTHRGDAFESCEFIMDFLKTRAPFWKKESTPQGDRWVASRDSDSAAAKRWEKSD